jgi:hypothetical protein
MKRRMAVVVLLAFAATSAAEAQSSRGRSGEGRRSGGHSGARRSSGGHLSVARSAGRPVARAHAAGARYSSSRSRSAYYGRGRAVPRGSVGFAPRSSARYRHPRVGSGTGYFRGRGHGYGYRSYGYGRSHHGRSRHYRSYPYHRGYGYSPYGWGGLGLSFYYSSGYPYAVGYSAPSYDIGYVIDESYPGDGGEPREEYSDRGDPRADDAELRLDVMPDDASVWIDGEFRGTARDLERLALSPGRHQVEVVRPGFRTATREVEVRRGATASLRIELERP